MTLLVALPILIPLTAAALGFAAWRRVRLQAWVSAIGAGALLASTIALVVAVRPHPREDEPVPARRGRRARGRHRGAGAARRAVGEPAPRGGALPRARAVARRRPAALGFHAKLLLVRAGLEEGRWVVVAIALLVSLLTLYSMSKLWNEAFAKAPPVAPAAAALSRRSLTLRLAPIGALAALTVAIGLAPGLLFALSADAAAQLLDPAEYVAAVLGGAR